MRTIVVKTSDAEKIAAVMANKRNDIYGVSKMKPKAKGSVSRFVKNTGLTKGVKSGRMKTFYMEGFSPKEKMAEIVKVGDIVYFTLKGEKTIGKVEKFNDSTFTVSIDGLDRKKAIRYNMFVGRVNEV